MTAPTWTPGLCPQCFGEAYAPLSDGRRLCLNGGCRLEYDEGDEPVPNMVPPAVVVPSIDGPPGDEITPGRDRAEARSGQGEPWDGAPLSDGLDLALQISEARRTYLDRAVIVHDLEQEGTVTAIDDDGTATVEFGSGFYITAEPDEFSLVETDVMPDEVVGGIVSTDLAVVAQMLRAGIETIDTQGDAVKIGMAPDGWLPMEADIMPVIEHGAAYLIAWLATTYKIPVSDLENAATAFTNAATAAREATQT